MNKMIFLLLINVDIMINDVKFVNNFLKLLRWGENIIEKDIN